MRKVTARMVEKYGCPDCADMRFVQGKNGAISNMRCTNKVCPYSDDFKPFKKYVDWLAANDVEYGLV